MLAITGVIFTGNSKPGFAGGPPINIYLVNTRLEKRVWLATASDVAEDLLMQFEKCDWKQLKNMSISRDAQWQGYLISILSPNLGCNAQDIMLDLAQSQNAETAFEAMYTISFYCGINTNSEGQFIDQSIVHSEFKERLISNTYFLELIPKIGRFVGRKYELLQQVLCSQP